MDFIKQILSETSSNVDKVSHLNENINKVNESATVTDVIVAFEPKHILQNIRDIETAQKIKESATFVVNKTEVEKTSSDEKSVESKTINAKENGVNENQEIDITKTISTEKPVEIEKTDKESIEGKIDEKTQVATISATDSATDTFKDKTPSLGSSMMLWTSLPIEVTQNINGPLFENLYKEFLNSGLPKFYSKDPSLAKLKPISSNRIANFTLKVIMKFIAVPKLLVSSNPENFQIEDEMELEINKHLKLHKYLKSSNFTHFRNTYVAEFEQGKFSSLFDPLMLSIDSESGLKLLYQFDEHSFEATHELFSLQRLFAKFCQEHLRSAVNGSAEMNEYSPNGVPYGSAKTMRNSQVKYRNQGFKQGSVEGVDENEFADGWKIWDNDTKVKPNSRQPKSSGNDDPADKNPLKLKENEDLSLRNSMKSTSKLVEGELVIGNKLEELISELEKSEIEGSEVYQLKSSGEIVILIPSSIEDFYDEDDLDFMGVLYLDGDAVFLEDGEDDGQEVGDESYDEDEVDEFSDEDGNEYEEIPDSEEVVGNWDDEVQEEVELDNGDKAKLLPSKPIEENGEKLYEAFKPAIRGGKRVKIKIKLRKKRLSPARRLALAKARKKAHSAKANRNRKKSLNIRRRLISSMENPKENVNAIVESFVNLLEDVEEVVNQENLCTVSFKDNSFLVLDSFEDSELKYSDEDSEEKIEFCETMLSLPVQERIQVFEKMVKAKLKKGLTQFGKTQQEAKGGSTISVKKPSNESVDLKVTLDKLKAPNYVFESLKAGKVQLVKDWIELNQ